MKPASRMLVSCYWIFTITIIAAYSGNLIAFLTVQKLKLPLNNLEELAVNPEYQAGVHGESSFSELFKVPDKTFVFSQSAFL